MNGEPRYSDESLTLQTLSKPIVINYLFVLWSIGFWLYAIAVSMCIYTGRLVPDAILYYGVAVVISGVIIVFERL